MSRPPRPAPRRSVFDRIRIGSGGGLRLQVVVLWVMATAAAACAFAGRAEMAMPATMATAALLGAALLFAQVARATLLDALLALSPRDAMLLAVGALGVAALPTLGGLYGWDYSMAALLVFLAPMTVHKWGTARFMAAGGAMALGALCVAPLPPVEAVVAWLGATLLAIRVEAVVLRLEAHASHASVPVATFLRETLPSVVVPLAGGVALLLWLGPGLLPHTRYLVWEARLAGERLNQLDPPSVDQLAWDTMILAALVIGLILAIVWFEKQLGTRRKGAGAESAAQLDATESRAFAPAEDEALALDEANDAQGRILARFRRWLAVGEKVGHPRARHETPAEVLARFGRELDAALAADPAARELVERAAYSHLPMNEDDEATFERWARGAESTLREAAARRAAAKAALGSKS